MYNENFNQFLQTMGGVLRNVAQLIKEDEYYRDKIAVCLIADGREVLQKTDKTGKKLTNDFLVRMEDAGLFNIDFLNRKNCSNQNDEDYGHAPMKNQLYQKIKTIVKADFESKVKTTKIHNKGNTRFEYSTMNVIHTFSKKVNFKPIFEEAERKDQEESHCTGSSKSEPYCNFHGKIKDPIEWITQKGKYEFPEIDFFFMLKQENAGKIESHYWFFRGMCQAIKPDLCLLLDVGTIPMGNSIARLVKYMDCYKDTGGCCGEIEVYEPTLKELGGPTTQGSRLSRFFNRVEKFFLTKS